MESGFGFQITIQDGDWRSSGIDRRSPSAFEILRPGPDSIS